MEIINSVEPGYSYITYPYWVSKFQIRIPPADTFRNPFVYFLEDFRREHFLFQKNLTVTVFLRAYPSVS